MEKGQRPKGKNGQKTSSKKQKTKRSRNVYAWITDAFALKLMVVFKIQRPKNKETRENADCIYQ
jgi:hypothetical protein